MQTQLCFSKKTFYLNMADVSCFFLYLRLVLMHIRTFQDQTFGTTVFSVDAVFLLLDYG